MMNSVPQNYMVSSVVQTIVQGFMHKTLTAKPQRKFFSQIQKHEHIKEIGGITRTGRVYKLEELRAIEEKEES